MSISTDQFGYKPLIDLVTAQEKELQAKITDNKGTMDISAMFDLQLMTNKFSQASEAATQVIASKNQAVLSALRNIK